MTTEQDILFAKLNLETAVIPWLDLQRFFAQGKVLLVNPDQDLVQIATQIAADQADPIQKLTDELKINPVSDQQAKAFSENQARVWAVVVVPWVLIQQIKKKF